MSRHLRWPVTHNVRDLGGLPLRPGGTTRRGSVVRGDNPDALTDAGWAAAWEHGVRTVIDLREPGEDPPATGRPSGIRTVSAPLDDHTDTGFWTAWGGGLDCTPLYYPAFLERFPQRITTVVRHVADAPDGGVLVHCSSGRDRTGLVVLVLLALAGVTRDAIVADYRESTSRLEPVWRDLDAGDQTGKIERLVEARGTTIERSVGETVDGLDAEAYLRTHGLSADEVHAVRARLAPGTSG